MPTSSRRRWLRAQSRDMHVLLREFRFSLLMFGLLVGAGTLLFWLLYEAPGDGAHLSLNRSLYAAFSLIFFQTGNVAYPDNPWLDTLYYLMPVAGLGVIGDGLVRFGVQVFNKEVRKEEWNVSLASTYAGHVVVCGAGHVGFRVIEQLAQMGEEVGELARRYSAAILPSKLHPRNQAPPEAYTGKAADGSDPVATVEYVVPGSSPALRPGLCLR